tara:strand:+ start:3770 stop:5011 length:1242 start_codon:yes stop_codon:yes gene_type:complete
MVSTSSVPGFDLAAVRSDFPILSREKYGKPLVYFDNAASTQKPRQVIERIKEFYSTGYANIHRGLHFLSEEATANYESARATVAAYIGASTPDEIVFTRNATESINLVAATFVPEVVPTGSSIVLTVMEHHANIVPWQIVAKKLGLRIRPVLISRNGELDRDDFSEALKGNVGMVALSHVSNSLGTINPVKELVAEAKEKGIPVLLDGAQAVPHFRVNVQELDCDFYAFSGHKLFGPTGIGVLFGKAELLEKMPPYQGGGDMIERVSFSGTTFASPPARFEAGTPHIAGAIGLAEAIRYVERVGPSGAEQHEAMLLDRASCGMKEIEGLRIIGEAEHKVAVASFVIDGVHPHDLATFLDRDGVAVRAGHHCTMPLWEHLGLSATTRASFAFYNTFEEVDVFLESLRRTVELLR